MTYIFPIMKILLRAQSIKAQDSSGQLRTPYYDLLRINTLVPEKDCVLTGMVTGFCILIQLKCKDGEISNA